ncbi:hypothetical protein HH212_05240 [Massilia forsythiae]|uniref:Uncharacterized protein n=1 Tax=Massilia forsythiae TaxID=2728020 RepID=A0A7Z2ZRI0_9BURK|nr:hypothetical protein [Massilia forsythiae]QJD99500.1 hypothetical protein HH212_05240 [Massilia forsythiae]
MADGSRAGTGQSAGQGPGILDRIGRIVPARLQARPRQRRAARDLALLAGLTALSAPLLALLYHLLGFDAAGAVVLGGGAAMVAAPFALRAGLPLPLARDQFVGALYLLKVWLALHLGGIGAPTVSWFALCPMVALLLGGVRAGLAWGAIVVPTLAVLFAAGRHAGVLPLHPIDDAGLLQLAGALGLVVLASIVVALACAGGGVHADD